VNKKNGQQGMTLDTPGGTTTIFILKTKKHYKRGEGGHDPATLGTTIYYIVWGSGSQPRRPSTPPLYNIKQWRRMGEWATALVDPPPVIIVQLYCIKMGGVGFDPLTPPQPFNFFNQCANGLHWEVCRQFCI